MSTEKDLHARSGSKCELCGATDNLTAYEIPPSSDGSADQCVLICATCHEQIENPDKIDV
ncbi:MAG: PhnA protein, partial [Gammaproteobacteria bacterium]|nr:PhnA protein [Gammaproteobacteria bacterium]